MERVLNQTFDRLGLEQHPDKTLIGRTKRGFDFLGYRFEPDALSVADQTVERFKEHMARLYEQKPEGGYTSTRLGLYVQRWFRWVRSGIPKSWVVGLPYGHDNPDSARLS